MKINRVWGVLAIVFGVLLLLSALVDYLKPGQYVATKAKQIFDNINVPGIALNRIGNFEKETGTTTIDTTGHPKLVLTDRAGKIRVTADPNAKHATIKFEKGVASALNDAQNVLHGIQVKVTTNGDNIRIDTVYPDGYSAFQSAYVDFDISVPPSEAVDLQSNAGEISTSGLQSAVTANTNAGKIDISGFKDSVSAHTNAGEVLINAGQDIHKIDASNNAGSVQVWLPEYVNLHVDAETNVGVVNTNFPLTLEKHLPGSEVHGDIGTGKDGTVSLKTNTGEIQINKP